MVFQVVTVHSLYSVDPCSNPVVKNISWFNAFDPLKLVFLYLILHWTFMKAQSFTDVSVDQIVLYPQTTARNPFDQTFVYNNVEQ